jgi:putative aminopeptidase FrvX
MDVFELLKNLTETPGPSGFETEIAEAVRQGWQPYADSFTVDRVGNLVAVREGQGENGANGRRPRLLLAAHMDEIALMVKQIVEHPKGEDGYGFLRLSGVGGVDIRHLYGQQVTVHGSIGGRHDLNGVIGALPVHLLPEDRRNNAFGYEELVVDTGLSAGRLRQMVSVGDYISFRQPLRKLAGKRITGKALDNRASVAAVAVCLEYLQGRRHAWDVVAVATVQEETALLGAYTSAYEQRPDAAVALDVTFGKGPGTGDNMAFGLDEGPILSLGANVHPGMFQALKDAASALEMKVFTETHGSHSGTDAYGIQIAREGIPTGLISIPLRYMHTMVETISTSDVERTGRLLGEFIARLDEKFIDKLAAGMMEEEKE